MFFFSPFRFQLVPCRKIAFVGGGGKQVSKYETARKNGQNNINFKYEDTAVQSVPTVPVSKLRYMLAEKLKGITVATTRGRQQGHPKASGLRTRGVKGLSYFAARPSLDPFLFFWKSQPGFRTKLTCFLLGVLYCTSTTIFVPSTAVPETYI